MTTAAGVLETLRERHAGLWEVCTYILHVKMYAHDLVSQGRVGVLEGAVVME